MGRKFQSIRRGSETKADLGTPGKAAESQKLTKGSSINTNRSLIEPILSALNCDSLRSTALPLP